MKATEIVSRTLLLVIVEVVTADGVAVENVVSATVSGVVTIEKVVSVTVSEVVHVALCVAVNVGLTTTAMVVDLFPRLVVLWNRPCLARPRATPRQYERKRTKIMCKITWLAWQHDGQPDGSLTELPAR